MRKALNLEIMKEKVVIFAYLKITELIMAKIIIIIRQVTDIFSREITPICSKMGI